MVEINNDDTQQLLRLVTFFFRHLRLGLLSATDHAVIILNILHNCH